MLPKQLSILLVTVTALLYANVAPADNVEELIELFRIKEEIESQHKECLDGSAQSIEAEIQYELESERLEIEPGDEDWALLIAIYSEFYNALCDYLSGEEILNFYKSEFRKRFTPEEIDTLIEFHRTPAGKKLNNELFEINRIFGKTLSERQSIDAYEAQRRFEEHIEGFWKYRDEKLNGDSREQDA